MCVHMHARTNTPSVQHPHSIHAACVQHPHSIHAKSMCSGHAAAMPWPCSMLHMHMHMQWRVGQLIIALKEAGLSTEGSYRQAELYTCWQEHHRSCMTIAKPARRPTPASATGVVQKRATTEEGLHVCGAAMTCHCAVLPCSTVVLRCRCCAAWWLCSAALRCRVAHARMQVNHVTAGAPESAVNTAMHGDILEHADGERRGPVLI